MIYLLRIASQFFPNCFDDVTWDSMKLRLGGTLTREQISNFSELNYTPLDKMLCRNLDSLYIFVDEVCPLEVTLEKQSWLLNISLLRLHDF